MQSDPSQPPSSSPPQEHGANPQQGMEPSAATSMTPSAYQQYMQQMGAAPNAVQYAQLQQSAAQGYYGMPPQAMGMPGGGPYGGMDEQAMYAAYMGAMQQSTQPAMYSGGGQFGGPAGGMGYAMGPPSGGFYGSSPYPGPAYYDPYGMINPAACVAPVTTQTMGGAARGGRKKKSGPGYCGCC